MREALAALDVVVAIDVFMTETARLADYVLPAVTQFEKHEETFEDLKLPPAEQREKLDERTIEAIESITGDLRAEQKRAVLAHTRALPDERPLRYRVDKQRISDFAALLRGHPGARAIPRHGLHASPRLSI